MMLRGEGQQTRPPGVGLRPQSPGPGLVLPRRLLRRGRQGLRGRGVPEQPEELPVVRGRGHRPLQGSQFGGRPAGLGLTLRGLGEGLLPDAVQLGPAPGPPRLPGLLPQVLGVPVGAAGPTHQGTVAPTPVERDREPGSRQLLIRVDQMDTRQQSLDPFAPRTWSGLQHLAETSFDGFFGDGQDVVGDDLLVAHPRVEQPGRGERGLDGGQFISRQAIARIHKSPDGGSGVGA